jgi:NADH-quinone oxidoreductase subunit J
MTTAFAIAAGVALASTLLVITARNPVYALLYLVISLLAVAVIFLLLGAPFAAALEIIVYAGAIMVLFLFVIMMLGLRRDEHMASFARRPLGWFGPGLLAGLLLAELVALLALGVPSVARPGAVSPKSVAVELLGPYLIAVELASMLLLAGLVGAWHLGRPGEPGGEDEP